MRNVQIPSNLINELGVQQIIDITDNLPKLKQKGKPDGWDGLVSPRALDALTDIVWHHSAEFLADNIKPETHANNHIRAGEGGFPYHFWIKDGQIYQGNDVLTFTYGVKSNNYQTVHCCVEGCFVPKDGRPADILSGANRSAMIALELTLRQLLPNYQRTNGHNYYKPTECPGYSMTKFKEELATVENRMKVQSTWPAKMQKVGELANQYNYMWDLMKAGENDGNAQWAVNQLLQVREIMKAQGLL